MTQSNYNFDIKGLQKYIDNITLAMNKSLEIGLLKIAEDTASTAKNLVGKQTSRGNKYYIVGGGRKTRRVRGDNPRYKPRKGRIIATHYAGKKGKPPNTDTGNLVQSIIAKPTIKKTKGFLEANISIGDSNVDYGKYLEDRGYPYISTAIKTNLKDEKIRKTFARALNMSNIKR